MYSQKERTTSDKYDWELDFEYYIARISRIDNFVLITTQSNWGKLFTHLVDFNSEKKLQAIDEIFLFYSHSKRYSYLYQ